MKRYERPQNRGWSSFILHGVDTANTLLQRLKSLESELKDLRM